jgi:chromosome segregation ATPase
MRGEHAVRRTKGQRLSDAQAEIISLNDQLRRNLDELRNLDGEVGRLREELTGEQTARARAEIEVTSLREGLEAAQRRANTAEQLQAEAEAAAEKASSEVARAWDEYGDQAEKLGTTQGELAALQETLGTTQEKLRAVEAQLVKLKTATTPRRRSSGTSGTSGGGGGKS